MEISKTITNEKIIKYEWIGVLTLVGILFYLLNRWTPLWRDDFIYIQIFGTDGKEHIGNVCDVIRSQYHHYFLWNGRFIPHFIDQTFIGLIGKDTFNYFNAVVFILFIVLLCKTTTERKSCYLKLTSIILLLILFVWPGTRYTFIWMTGACNYLWTATLVLYYDHLMKNPPKRSFFNSVLLFLYGFITGWTHEGIISGIAIASSYYFFTLPTTERKNIMPILIGFALGGIMLFASPGSWGRASSGLVGNMFNIFKIYAWAVIRLYSASISIILIAALAFLYYKNKNKAKHFIKENRYWFIAWLTAAVFMILTKFDSAYSRFGMELYAIILLLKMIKDINISLTAQNVLLAISVSTLIYILPIAKANYNNFAEAEERIKSTTSKVVTYHEIPYTFVRDRFTFGFLDYSDSPFYRGPNSWDKTCISNYYNKDIELKLEK